MGHGNAGQDGSAAAGRPLFVLWLDAHADFNTPETSPSGNIHGMPLAALCGEPGFRNRLFLYDPERGFREVAFKTNKMVLPYDLFSALAVLPDGGLCLGTRGRMTALLYGQLSD